MAETLLTLTARGDKYGLVTVLNVDGTLNRQFKITEVDLLALRVKGAGPPLGVTAQEWTGKTTQGDIRAWVGGQSHEVGDASLESDGSILALIAESWKDGALVQHLLRLAKSQFSGMPPKITGQAAAVSALDTTDLGGLSIISIKNGLVTWQ